MKIAVHPATPERWPDVEAVFKAKGCSVARSCWCMFYRRSGEAPSLPAGASRGESNRRSLRRLVDKGSVPGLIAYRDGAPVGWVSLAPREQFLRLEKSPVMKPVDDKPVWSVICFVVPAEHRGQGVARALLEAAVKFARKNGAKLVEGYPIDRPTRSSDDTMWFGSKSMYDRAGFEEVARRKPARPVVRLAVK
jgi:GNAT superfamily N-acetyltransferase